MLIGKNLFTESLRLRLLRKHLRPMTNPMKAFVMERRMILERLPVGQEDTAPYCQSKTNGKKVFSCRHPKQAPLKKNILILRPIWTLASKRKEPKAASIIQSILAKHFLDETL